MDILHDFRTDSVMKITCVSGGCHGAVECAMMAMPLVIITNKIEWNRVEHDQFNYCSVLVQVVSPTL